MAVVVVVVFCKASLLHESMKGDDTPKNVVRVSASSKKSLSTFCSPLVVIALLLLHIKKFVDTQSCCLCTCSPDTLLGVCSSWCVFVLTHSATHTIQK